MIKIINRDGAEVQLGGIVEDKEGKQYSVEDIEGKTLSVLAVGATRKATKKVLATSLGLTTEGNTETLDDKRRLNELKLTLRDYWEDM
tara:strand:+ start:682 stop:945 length:264 start_codon:yes stop_codon:yes gene_type:complete